MFFKKKEKINLEELRKLFESQKQALTNKGYLEIFGKEVFEQETRNAWKRLEATANTIAFYRFGNIPLLLVANITDRERGIGLVKATTELDLHAIKNPVPQHLFSILLDVENGQKMMAKSAKEALKKFTNEGRGAFGLNETIALLVQCPEVLKNHYLIAAGASCPKDGEDLPILWLLDEHGAPQIHYAWHDIAHGAYGAASYAIKL